MQQKELNNKVWANKLLMFCKLCEDVNYREEVFNSKTSHNILELLDLRDFPIKQLISCAAFKLQDSLLPYEFEYTKIKKRDKRIIKVTVEHQLEAISSLLNKNEVNTPYNRLFFLTGITDFEKCKFVSFLLAFWYLKSAKHNNNNNKQYDLGRPFYYNIVGGFNEPFRDDKNFKEQVGKINLLILNGLSPQSSKLKIEKVIDIINNFTNTKHQVDIIILGAGVDPLVLGAHYLNSTFQLGLYFNEGLITNI